ncbi:MAG: M48 family metallopeptidase [Bacteroidota bacterium]
MKWLSAPTIAISRALLLLLILTVGLGPYLSAQSYDDYKPLRSKGPIPQDFLVPASLKYDLEMVHWADSSKEYQEALGAYFAEDFYYLNRLLRSGQVIFGDTLSGYINRLADHILRDQPALRQQLRFYIVRSTVANASSTHDGIIFVNMGLLARLENEAQLAFVLCHEISHFVERHPLKSYQQYLAAESSRPNDPEWQESSHSSYSKEIEKEADRLGLGLYLKAGYSAEIMESAFEVLKVADQDFAQKAFDRSLFETQYLQFNKDQWPDTLEYAFDQSFNSTTHPHPDERLTTLLDVLKSQQPQQSGQIWQIGREAFRAAKNISRYELCQRYQMERAYEAGIYAAYSLLEQGKHPQYLRKQIAYGLYALAQYSHVGEFWDVHQDYEEIVGPSRRIAHLMEQLTAEERTVLALSVSWRAFQKAPQDSELKRMCEDLMQALGQYYVDGLDGFLGIAEVKEQVGLSFARGGLADLLEGEAFRKAMTQNLQIGLNKKRAFKPSLKQGEARLKKIEGFKLGLDSLILINPRYQKLDRRENPATQLLASAEGEANLKNSLKKHANSLELELQILSYDSLGVDDVDRLNDIQLFQEWLFELSTNQELARISILQDEVAGLAERYHTPYFAWSQVVVVTDKRPGRKMMLWMGLFPPILPYSMYYVFTPAHTLFFYTTIYDLKRGKYLLVYPEQVRMKDRKEVINATIYDLLLQVKTK